MGETFTNDNGDDNEVKLTRAQNRRGASPERGTSAMSEQEMREIVGQFTSEEKMAFFWMLSILVQSPSSAKSPQAIGSSTT